MSSDAAVEAGEVNPPASIAMRRRLVAASLRVGNPANNARDLPAQADPLRECQIELAVDDIRPYEHNPRRTRNARFADIMESIRASGMRNPVAVTRRPGEVHFIVEAGGNTRLLAVQQLLRETGEARFQKLWVLFRPWRSESHVLISHLIENEQRSDMTFWDKASGIAALKVQIEAELGRTLSARQLESELKAAGIAVSRTRLSYYHFATERLRLLGEVIADLSGGDVTRIQPRLKLIRTYARLRVSINEDALYEQLLEPVFRRHVEDYCRTQAFGAEALCADCEAALAQYLNEPVDDCRKALDALAREAASATSNPFDAGEVGGTDTNNERTAIDSAESAKPCADKSPVTTSGATARTPDRNLATPATPCALAAPPADKALVSEYDTVAQLNSAARIDADEQPCARHAESRRQLGAAMKRFAQLSHVGDCLRIEEGAPSGYSVDALPVDDGATAPLLQRRAWLLLRLLCAHGSGTRAGGASVRDIDDGALAVDLPFLCWLFARDDAAASGFRQVMSLCRAGGLCLPHSSASNARAARDAECA